MSTKDRKSSLASEYNDLRFIYKKPIISKPNHSSTESIPKESTRSERYQNRSLKNSLTNRILENCELCYEKCLETDLLTCITCKCITHRECIFKVSKDKKKFSLTAKNDFRCDKCESTFSSGKILNTFFRNQSGIKCVTCYKGHGLLIQQANQVDKWYHPFCLKASTYFLNQKVNHISKKKQKCHFCNKSTNRDLTIKCNIDACLNKDIAECNEIFHFNCWMENQSSEQKTLIKKHIYKESKNIKDRYYYEKIKPSCNSHCTSHISVCKKSPNFDEKNNCNVEEAINNIETAYNSMPNSFEMKKYNSNPSLSELIEIVNAKLDSDIKLLHKKRKSNLDVNEISKLKFVFDKLISNYHNYDSDLEEDYLMKSSIKVGTN